MKQKSIDYNSHEGIMAGFADSVQDVIKKVEEKQKELDSIPNYQDESARAHETSQILKKWFFNNGYI